MSVCALVGASDFNHAHFTECFQQNMFDCIVAVDGGYASLQAIDVSPDLALGDFDSLGYIPQNVAIERFPSHKDASDMELALERSLVHDYSGVYVYGALGKRLDHTLANLQLFSEYSEKGMTLTVIDEDSMVKFLTGPCALQHPAQERGTVSVFSMSDKATGVCERGLEYELTNATLTNRTSLGLSNELKGEPIEISVETGTLAIFLPL